MNCATAYDLWTRLKELFEDKGLLRRITLLRKLVTTQLDACESMRAYVGDIFKTSNKLQGIGFEVPDEWLASILLAGLPNDFQPMIMGLESCGAILTADMVRSKLLDAAFNENSSKSAFINKGGHQRKNKSGIKCFNCQKRGHMSKSCPDKNFSGQKKAPSNKNGVDMTAFVTTFTSKAFFLNDHRDDWYIDSGASQHMTPDEKLFAKLDSSNIKQITSASNDKMSVKGVGDFSVCIKDNEVDLNNVLCVLGLSANLLSVAQMVKNANKVIFDKGNCKIFNRSDMCVAEVNSENDVYRLPVQRVQAMAAMTNNMDALMWHRKLGHININDLCKMRNGLGRSWTASILGIETKMKSNIVLCARRESRLESLFHEVPHALKIFWT